MLDDEYISEIGGKFSIDRVFNDRKYNFGIFDTLDEALDYLDFLEEEGWPLDVNDQSGEILPNNIEVNNGKFSVFKYIMGEKIIFGEFDSLDEAKRIKSNLISNAWESLEFNDRSAYGKYIRKSGNKFVVTRIYQGKTHVFGYFDSLEEAMDVRERLIETNWGDLNIKHQMRYGKYIAFNGMFYTVQKIIDGELIIFGYFYELEDAIKQRDFLIRENWSKLEVPDDSYNHIRKMRNKYVVFNYIDDEFQYYGEFDSLDEAKEFRNELIINDWVIPEEETLIEKISEHVFFDGEYYTVEKSFNDEIRIYGVFKNKDMAIHRENSQNNSEWAGDYAIKTEEYPYGENIIPFDYIFIVEIMVNSEIEELGTFMSFDEALTARNEYFSQFNEDGSEKIKLIFSVKVGKSYKNRGWSIIRDTTYDLIPKLDYEDQCNIVVDGIPVEAKLNILPRIFYDASNLEVVNHLKELCKTDPNQRINVELLLDKELPKNDFDLQNQIDELKMIIEEKDNEISELKRIINQKEI